MSARGANLYVVTNCCKLVFVSADIRGLGPQQPESDFDLTSHCIGPGKVLPPPPPLPHPSLPPPSHVDLQERPTGSD